jgi:hypothetical protein
MKKARSAIKLYPDVRMIGSDDTRAIFYMLHPI